MAHAKRSPLRAAVSAAATIALVTACGSADDAQPPATIDTTATTDLATTTPPATSEPDAIPSTVATTTSPSPTDPTTTEPTTAPRSATTEIAIEIPGGTLDVDTDDLFVLTRAGDLELWRGALAAPPGRPIAIADYPDPFAPVTEGSGPNVVDDVAGEIGGTIVFADCCEPISGNIVAATGSGEFAPIAPGYSPALSPAGNLLGTANDYQISRTAADTDGVGLARALNQSAQDAYLNVRDLTWTSNATSTPDDDRMVLLGWDEAGWRLHEVDATTLDLSPGPAVDVPVPPAAPDADASFVGHGPDAEVVVAMSDGTTTRLVYYSATALEEIAALERTLPGSATSIRLADDGVGLLWVDGGVLYHLPAGTVTAERLGTEVIAAWFARSAAT